MFLYFLRTIQLFHINFFKDVLGINQRVILLKKLFTANPCLLKVILRYFMTYFEVSSPILESRFPSYLKNICTDAFCLTLTVNVLSKISQLVYLCWGHYAVFFGLILGIFLNVSRNLKNYFDIWHECYDITAMVIKLKKMCCTSLCFGQFWLVLIHLVLCSSNIREPFNISIWVFVYHTFSKDKVRAVATTEVKHTVISGLLYLCVYLYAS